MTVPFEHFFELGKLSAAEQDIHIVADADALKRIAQWADIGRVDIFEAHVALRRLSQSRFHYSAELKGDAVQSCVVTLAPVAAHIVKNFERELHLVSHLPRDLAAHGDHSISEADDETPEEIETTRYDLAAPLLEEFALALDPYPRAPGVAFESPASGEASPENPFAVLKVLKNKG
jgi:hypothetical protein